MLTELGAQTANCVEVKSMAVADALQLKVGHQYQIVVVENREYY